MNMRAFSVAASVYGRLYVCCRILSEDGNFTMEKCQAYNSTQKKQQDFNMR